ncbi:AraC family transcriptional regulator [Rathayibacter sp. AY1B5]|uniref:AraC family transcriptional regulator n=1 Tax=Rathayibacter sp. AY1B5 TaxID=2080530 RepID=UPI000CE810F2|nr:AraC family transcriptional regulator [Rathayibacter sp. AY1B5]PPI23824.1 hypothetical protein C5D44_12550 [Rathayibacter sp. AY1B5]
MLRSDPVVLERRVGLGGASAAAWLGGRGFATAAAARGFRLVADTYRAPDLALARILRGPGETSWGGSRSPGVSLSMVTEGALELLLPSGSVRVERGQAVFTRATRVLGTRNTGPVGTIEIVFGSTSSRFDLQLGEEPLLVEGALRGVRTLSALANEILGSTDESSIPLPTGYRTALEALASDVLDRIGPDLPRTLDPADRRLVLGARRIIRERLGDPALSVRRLAAELAVSERRLQRAFAPTGTTAKGALRLARAETAEKLLRTYPAVTPIEAELVAHQVGLPGVRALKDHLAAHGLSLPGPARSSVSPVRPDPPRERPGAAPSRRSC